MKTTLFLSAALLAFALAGCEPPAEQDEPVQPEPDTTAEQPAAGGPNVEVEDNPDPMDMETTSSELGTATEEESSEDTPVEESEEPPAD